MLFWIFVITIVLGIALIIGVSKISDKYSQSNEDNNKIVEFLYYNDEPFIFTGYVIALISGIIAVIMLTVIICSHCGIDAQVQKWRETYSALTYKLESGACRDDFGLLNKEIIDEIQHWNEDVAYKKRIQRDFWMGIFYPNVFDEFEAIDYERYRGKE